jgi:hypothetical protein
MIISLLRVWIVSIFSFCCVHGIESYDLEIEQFSLGFPNQEPLFISLGSSCGPGHVLRHFEIREAAFPLDWLLSIDNEGLIAMLKDVFLYFTDIPKQLEEFVFGCVGLATYFWSSLAPCHSAMAACSRRKNLCRLLAKTRFFKLFRYKHHLCPHSCGYLLNTYYTARDSRIGFSAGLKADLNQLKRRGQH